MERVRELIEQLPQSSKAKVRLSVLALEQGDYSRALKGFEQSAEGYAIAQELRKALVERYGKLAAGL